MSPQAEPADLRDHFLRALTRSRHEPIEAANMAVVVAHPDDETIGCGALLSRMQGATVVLVTDGAPRNLADAEAYGFASAQDYADRRLVEMREALSLAKLPEDALVALGIPDQEAALNLAPLTRRLLDLAKRRRINVLLTHAYEGGHPDHDAAAFAVHAACRLLAHEGWRTFIMEMPFYRLSDSGAILQQFHPVPEELELTLPLDPDERALKRSMIAAHQTQREVLRTFPLDFEKFRPAPAYDFRAPPSDGRLLYEAHDWGMTGARWLELVRAASVELRLESAP
jgi:LmbE family N-acetylglucosaminyl deacetylase